MNPTAVRYQEFKNKYLGKGINFDSKYGNQCVDVYREYCNFLGFKQSPPVVGAKSIAINYRRENFTYHVNTPWFIPKQGDICVWNGKYGHVAIVDSANLWSFRAFGQNWYEGGTVNDGKGVCYITQHNYLKPQIICFLRPKL